MSSTLVAPDRRGPTAPPGSDTRGGLLRGTGRHPHLVAVCDGRVVASGSPAEVVTREAVRQVFGIDSRVVPDPVTATPVVVPVGVDRVGRSAATPDVR